MDTGNQHRPEDSYTSYAHSVHTDVLLSPTSTNGPDPAQQHALLSLLHTKLGVEHGGHGVHGLFLRLDEGRTGRLDKATFHQALSDVMGVPLSEAQLGWLMARFDTDHDAGIDYQEFAELVKAAVTGVAGGATGLTWKPAEPVAAAAAAAASLPSAKATPEQTAYAQALQKAHDELVATAGDEPSLTAQVLRKLATVALGKLGGLKKAFAHMDGDGDHRLSRQDLGHTLEHHLGLQLAADELEALFAALDFEGRGAVMYHAFVRVLSSYAEDTEGGSKAGTPWSPGRSAVEEGNEKAGFGDDSTTTTTTTTTTTQEAMEDKAVLLQAQEVLHARGLHAHKLLTQLLPECEGKVDTGGLQVLFGKLGLPISDECAARLLHKADLMATGKLVSWELVRLLSSAGASDESEGEGTTLQE